MELVEGCRFRVDYVRERRGQTAQVNRPSEADTSALTVGATTSDTLAAAPARQAATARGGPVVNLPVCGPR